jgi:putative polyhydroxyalkanoate system protein
MSREAAKGSTVPDPLVITISHRLGRDEAKRRLDDGLGHIRGQLAGFVNSLDYTWTGYRLDFSVTAMRQGIDGLIQIEDDSVRVEIRLPLLLRMLANKITGRVRSKAALLLDKPPGA